MHGCLLIKISHLMGVLFVLLLLGSTAAVSAEPALRLEWIKNSGLDLAGGIHGARTVNAVFTVNGTTVNGTCVEFYLDDQLQKNDTVTPYGWTFDTDHFSEGIHVLRVRAYNALGESTTVEQQINFVGFPVFAVVGVVLFASLVFALLLVVSWFYIKSKAKKRNLKSTLSE